MANVILSRLIIALIDSLRGGIVFDAIKCSTDSQICSAWIRSTNKGFKTFVQNRVIEIRKNVSREKWFHCRSESNPADLLTRNNIDNLSREMWFKGPVFLSQASRDIIEEYLY